MLASFFTGSRKVRIGILACMTLVAAFPSRCLPAANSSSSDDASAKGRPVYRSQCGIYCLYAALRLKARHVDFAGLVKPAYLGSRQGSSLAELKKAAQDHALFARTVGRLTTADLSQSPYPAILHVKSASGQSEYDHYILFLARRWGRALLFDPPEPIKLVHFKDLAPLWDGKALLVSDRPIDLGSVLAPARKRFVLHAVGTLALIFMLHYVKRLLPQAVFRPLRNRVALSIAQAALFAIAALLFGFLYHFTNDAGLLANHTATAAIQRAHLPNFIPKITEKKLRRLLAAGAVLIDARLKSDFERGHIQNAVSIPINASALYRGLDITCGCFNSPDKISYLTLIRALAILLAALAATAALILPPRTTTRKATRTAPLKSRHF